MEPSSLNNPYFTHINQNISPSKAIMENLKKSIFSNKNSKDFVKKWTKRAGEHSKKVKLKKNRIHQKNSKKIPIENCFLLSQRKKKWSPNKYKLEKVKSMVARKG